MNIINNDKLKDAEIRLNIALLFNDGLEFISRDYDVLQNKVDETILQKYGFTYKLSGFISKKRKYYMPHIDDKYYDLDFQEIIFNFPYLYGNGNIICENYINVKYTLNAKIKGSTLDILDILNILRCVYSKCINKFYVDYQNSTNDILILNFF